jgi:ADP-heptose:LPS heptosyltransferase
MFQNNLLLNCCTHASGDIVCLSAVVRDLKLSFPTLRIGVNTTNMELWQNNPHILHERWNIYTRGVAHCEICYDRATKPGSHLIEYLRQTVEHNTGLIMERGPNHGELFLTPEEINAPRKVEQPYWVVIGGGKKQISVKWYPYYQEIVDQLRGKIHFVQCGGGGNDFHEPLNGVTNLVGRSTIREFLQLIYHAEGVLSPITFAMHANAALDKPKKRGVVICGGAEDVSLTHYPHNTYLGNVGSLDCCKAVACWRTKVHDDVNIPVLEDKRCLQRIQIRQTPFAKCMTMIPPDQVCAAIEKQMET